jgi:hypothetical protein
MGTLTGVSEVSQDVLKNAMRFTIRTGGNLMTFGNAGIGKTEMAIQAAREEGFETVYLNLSVLEAPDLIGLPVIDREKMVTVYAPPSQLPLRPTTDEERASKKPIVLLVDEVDKAKPELQNPCLELFQFRGINGRPMNIQSVIATGNLPDENAFSQPVSHALTNRCLVLRVGHSFDPWITWAVEARVNPLIIGFLSKNQEFLLQPAASGDPTAYCNPSPRAWTNAGRDLDQTSSKDPIEFQQLLVAGRVGTAAAVKFRVWLDHYRHIEPLVDRLVKDGTFPKFDSNTTIDRILVTAISSVSEVVRATQAPVGEGKDKEKHQKNVDQVTKNVFAWLGTMQSEIQVGAAKSTLNMNMITQFKMTRIAEFMKVFTSLKSVMNE